jgi:hypothetical protein
MTTMKMTMTTMKMIKVTLACALALALTSTTAQATTILTVPDNYFVGLVLPGIPPSEDEQVVYINALIQLQPGATLVDCVGDNDCDRLISTIATNLPTATGATQTEISGEIGTQNQNIDVTGSAYIIAKYDADKAGSYVWYVAGLTSVDLPSHLGTCGNGNGPGCGLSNYSVVNGNGVPDGGATIGLLGLAMFGLGYLRRRIA